MPKFIVQMVDAYTREVLNTEDKIFDSERNALDYACECSSAFAEGAEVLSLSGHDYTLPEDVDFIVDELNEN